MRQFTEQTVIPVSLILVFCAVVVWAAKVDARGENTAAKVEKNTAYMEKTTESLQNIDKRLSRIEGKLDIEADE